MDEARWTRRDLLRAAVALGAGAMLPRWARADGGVNLGRSLDKVRSPFLRPFAIEMPVPPVLQPVSPFGSTRFVAANTRHYTLRVQEALHTFHPDLPPAPVWGYVGEATSGNLVTPGPTSWVTRIGEPALVRLVNELPAFHRGFGVPNMAMHRHGGFQSSEDDGYPEDLVTPGQTRDYYYEGVPEEDARESQPTLWYHDHCVDFTGANVYRGLAGFNVQLDDEDSGDETDPNPDALRLPSGPYDIGVVFQDRLFDFDGQLLYDQLAHDGFLGDTMLVNGVVQPFLRVKRRKYRFRFLNGANARFFELALSSGQPFVQVATEGGLLERPLERRSILMGMAERVDVIVDFSLYPTGAEIVLENRCRQDDGRGPDGTTSFGTPLLQFIVDGPADDPSVVRPVLRRPAPPSPGFITERRRIELGRTNGAWAINGYLWDPDRVLARPRLGETELWTFRNSSGGWWHPMHVHLNLFDVVSRNGAPPPPWEQAKKDTVVLGPNDEVDVRIRFERYRGRFVFHCHNIEHEDMAMMARFDTV